MANFLFGFIFFYAGFIIGLFLMNWILLGSINNVNDINDHYWR